MKAGPVMVVPVQKNSGCIERSAVLGAALLGVVLLAFGCTALADADEVGAGSGVRAPSTRRGPAPARASAAATTDTSETVDAQGGPNPARTNGESVPSAPPLEEQASEILPSGLPFPALDAGLADAAVTAPVPEIADGACVGGVRFGGACYRVWSLALTWDAARAACLSTASDLVKIESAEEDDFVATLTETSVWIGASDQSSDDEFIWTDGSALEFSNWAPGQPDDGQGLDCIEKRQEPNEPWYDQRCNTTTHFFICESQDEL